MPQVRKEWLNPLNPTVAFLPLDLPYLPVEMVDGVLAHDEWVNESGNTVKFELPIAEPFAELNEYYSRLIPDEIDVVTNLRPKRVRVRLVRRIEVKPGERIKLAAVHRAALHELRCVEPGCPKPSHCRFADHAHQIVGGLGPQLRLESEAAPSPLHPALAQAAAEEDARSISQIVAATDARRDASALDRAFQRARERAAKGAV